MNKNTVIGSILVVAIMIWWFYTSSNNVAQAKATQKAASADSVAALQTESENGSLLLPKAAPELKAAPVLGGQNLC